MLLVYYVYAHVRADTNKVFYIGIGHGNRSNETRRRNIYWQRVVLKAKGFRIVKLQENVLWEQACSLEKSYIKKYKLLLTNLTDGGEGMHGYKHTEETKQIIREKRKLQKFSKAYRKQTSKRMLGNSHAKGCKHSITANTKKSILMKGQQRALGYKHTPEEILKIKEASKRMWLKRKSIC